MNNKTDKTMNDNNTAPRPSETAPRLRFRGFSQPWKTKKLGDIALFNPKDELPQEFEYVDLESVVGTEMLFHRTENKSSAPSRAQRLARKGDLFYQTVRPYQKNNYLFDKNEDNYVFSSGYAQMRPFVDGYFLLSLVQREGFVKIVLDNCTGTSYPAINANNLAGIEVTTPTNKDEIHKIGDFFRNIDKIINAAERRVEKLRQLKAACLQQMFPRPGASAPRLRFRGFTQPWKETSFGELYELRSEKNDLTYGVDKIISVANMYFRPISYVSSDDYLRSYNVFKLGDIAFEGHKSKNFAHGRFVENYIGDGIVSHVFVVLKRKDDNYDINFWRYLINNEEIMRHILIRCTKASTMMNDLVVNEFLKESILAPSVAEQERIGAFFSALDGRVRAAERRVKKLRQLKAACLQQMFP